MIQLNLTSGIHHLSIGKLKTFLIFTIISIKVSDPLFLSHEKNRFQNHCIGNGIHIILFLDYVCVYCVSLDYICAFKAICNFIDLILYQQIVLSPLLQRKGDNDRINRHCL